MEKLLKMNMAHLTEIMCSFLYVALQKLRRIEPVQFSGVTVGKTGGPSTIGGIGRIIE